MKFFYIFPNFLRIIFLFSKGKRYFNSGPLSLPVKAILRGINKSFPFNPVLFLIRFVQVFQVSSLKGSLGKVSIAISRKFLLIFFSNTLFLEFMTSIQFFISKKKLILFFTNCQSWSWGKILLSSTILKEISLLL